MSIHKPKHEKNDTSAFHLRRNYNELNNEIFDIPSEEGYKEEIQDFIESLQKNTDRTNGIWYFSKDKKRIFRFNTSLKFYKGNKKLTTFGFEVVDWYNLENLSEEQYNEYINKFNNDKERRTINRWLQAVENEQGSNYDSDSLLKNRQTTRNDVRLAQEASSREPVRGQNFGGSRSNQRTSELAFLTPRGEVYGFVGKDGNIYLDTSKINSEHSIHEYTHLWDRVITEKNPKLWERGIQLKKILPTLQF